MIRTWSQLDGRPTSAVRKRLVVTAAQRDPRRVDIRSPWGTRHLRRESQQQMLCGAYTTDWFTFWHLKFNRDNENACTACSAFLQGSKATQHLSQRSHP